MLICNTSESLLCCVLKEEERERGSQAAAGGGEKEGHGEGERGGIKEQPLVSALVRWASLCMAGENLKYITLYSKVNVDSLIYRCTVRN